MSHCGTCHTCPPATVNHPLPCQYCQSRSVKPNKAPSREGGQPPALPGGSAESNGKISRQPAPACTDPSLMPPCGAVRAYLDTATGPRAVPGSQRRRTRKGDQSCSALRAGSDALRAGDGSRSVAGPSQSLAAVSRGARAALRHFFGIDKVKRKLTIPNVTAGKCQKVNCQESTKLCAS